MSEYNDIFLEVEKLIAESEKSDASGIAAGQEYLKSAQEKLSNLQKDGLHKKKSKSDTDKRKDKDKLSGSKSKFKKEEEEETKEKPDSSKELDKEFGEEEEGEDNSDDMELLDLGKSSKYSKLIDMLNQFRSAKSFTGKDIAPELKKWFERLSKPEKKMLHLFVKGLIQVTISGELGEEATVPSQLGFKVIDNKISKEKKQRIEDKMAGDSEDIEDKEDKEVSSDLPVKIESVQNKHKILEAIKRNAL